MDLEKYSFVRDPENDLKCAICLEVAKDPHQHEECGKLFCKECIDKYGRYKPCPHCRTQGSQYFRDNRSKKAWLCYLLCYVVFYAPGRRDIEDLWVCCDNCKWKGTVAKQRGHASTCEFMLVPCPKECYEEDGVIKSFLRKNIAKHLEHDCRNRDYKCDHCGERDTYWEITEVHYGKCGKKVVPCPNAGCHEVVLRQDLEDHVDNKCEYAVVLCKHEDIGCKVEMERRHMVAHEQDDSLHLHLALHAVARLQGTVEDLECRLKCTNNRVKHTENLLDSMRSLKTFALRGYRQKKEGNESILQSFHTRRNGYKMQVKVYANGRDNAIGTHVSVYGCLLEGIYDRKLEWPFTGEVRITMLNQLEDENHHTKTINISAMQSGSIWGLVKFAPHSILTHDWITNTQYRMDDTLYFRVSVQEKSGRPWLRCT